MKIEIYERAQELRKEIKQLQAARDQITKVIDRATPQLDIIDDNEQAARQNLAHVETRNNIETMIAELEHQFDEL